MSTLSAVYEIFWQRFLTLPVTLFTPHEKKKPHTLEEVYGFYL